jgi:hypothetical protein
MPTSTAGAPPIRFPRPPRCAVGPPRSSRRHGHEGDKLSSLGAIFSIVPGGPRAVPPVVSASVPSWGRLAFRTRGGSRRAAKGSISSTRLATGRKWPDLGLSDDPTGLNGTQCVPDGAPMCVSTHFLDCKGQVVHEKALAARGPALRSHRRSRGFNSRHLHWLVARVTTFRLLKRYLSCPIDQYGPGRGRLAELGWRLGGPGRRRPRPG